MKKNYFLLVAFLLTSIIAQAIEARLDSIVTYERADGETAFIKDGKMAFKYNSKNLPISEEYSGQDVDISDEETDYFMVEYTYDAQDRIELVITSILENGSKTPMLQEARTYNENNILIMAKQARYDDDSEEWTSFSVIDYVYDNELLKSKTTLLSLTASLTMLYSKTEYNYNSSGLRIETIEYTVDFITQEFVKESKTERVYEGGILKNEIHYIVAEDEWMKDWKDDYLYDDQGNSTEIKESSWDQTGSTWIEDGKNINTFDKNYSDLSLILPIFFNENTNMDQLLVNPLSKSEDFIKEGDEYVSYSYSDFYWNIDGDTQVTTTRNTNLKLYPNPNTGTFTIITEQRADITILNLAGQLMYTQTMPAGMHKISLPNPHTGIYMLKILENNMLSTQKFIIK